MSELCELELTFREGKVDKASDKDGTKANPVRTVQEPSTDNKLPHPTYQFQPNICY
jgi:hypothetical protein